ncbi:MAG: preQ(1) synthase [Puniceicoccales bacterium]|jgi:7-cyano-7-deazaguanine reductase|nr:preQ(1) synthase [Puniceicoccales bacterium]
MNTQPEDLASLTLLGRTKNAPSKVIETFPNKNPERAYVVELRTEEFTSLCPATGQPDFGVITIRYIPGPRIVESKSLKLYLWSFRNEGCFQEHLVNNILSDLETALDPVWLEVVGEFAPRGGIGITVRAECGQSPVSREGLR